MHRTILKYRWRSNVELFHGAVLLNRGKGDGANIVETYQTAAGSPGLVSFDCREVSGISSLGLQIVNALQLGHRNQASNLLSELNAASHGVQSEDIVPILDYCAKSPDPLFVMETWRVLEEKNIGLSGKCYMLIVRALCNVGYTEEAFNLVKFLGENHRVNFILPLYNYLLSACAKLQEGMHASQCLDMMDNQLLGKNEITYTGLLKLAVWQKNLSAVHEIWREYCKYYNMNIIALRKFIWTFTRLKDLDSAYNTLQQMVALAFQEGTFLYTTAEGKIRCPHLDIPIPLKGGVSIMGSHVDSYVDKDVYANPSHDGGGMIMNSSKAVHSLFCAGGDLNRATRMRMLEENKMGPIMKILRWSFNDVIQACAQCRQSELAERLIMQMQDLGLTPSSHTYNGLIRAIIPGRGIGDIKEVLKVMQKSNLKLYGSTLSTLSIGCSKALDLDLAEALLNQIEETPHIHPYNAFFVACNTMGQPERAVKILAKMRKLKIKPDIRTYELLFSLFGNVNAPYEEGNLLSQADVSRRIKVIEMDMLNSGIQHSHISIRNLLRALGTEGMVRELLQYLHAVEEQFSHCISLGTDVYNTVLQSLVESKENHMAIQMFTNMKLCGVQPDAATYHIMIDCCANIRSFRSACALVSLMLRDGFCPRTITYTALIKILVDYYAFDEALDLLDQAISEGNELDVLLFNTILRKAGSQGRIDVIEFVVEVMYREKIQPDPSTCCFVFNAYVERNFFGTAIEALQVLSMRMISQDQDTLEDVRMEYEHLIFTEEPNPEKQIMRIFEDFANIAAALLNLRWCSIAGYSISWMPGQSPWAKRLASCYDAQMTGAS